MYCASNLFQENLRGCKNNNNTALAEFHIILDDGPPGNIHAAVSQTWEIFRAGCRKDRGADWDQGRPTLIHPAMR